MCLLFLLPLFKAYLHVVYGALIGLTVHRTPSPYTSQHMRILTLEGCGLVRLLPPAIVSDASLTGNSTPFISCSLPVPQTALINVSNTDETLCCAMIRWAWRWTINNHKFDFIGHFKKWICFNSKQKINVRSLQKFIVSSADSTESLLQNIPHDLKSNKGTIFRDYI